MVIPLGTVFQHLWTTVVMVCSAIHVVSLIVYTSLSAQASTSPPPPSKLTLGTSLSFLNLGLSFLLAFLAFWMLAKIIVPSVAPVEQRTRFRLRSAYDKLPAAIQRQPLQTLAFFLLSFAYIMYSVTFSLALHDRVSRFAGRTPSLHMEGLSNSRETLSRTEAKWCQSLSGRYLSRRLYFAPNNPSLEVDLDTFAHMSRDEFSSDSYVSDCDLLNDVRAINACSLHNATKALTCYGREATVPVTILSTADIQKGSSSLGELTNLQVQQAHYKLLELFPERYRRGRMAVHQIPKIDWTVGVLFPEGSDFSGSEIWREHSTVLVKVGPMPGNATEWLSGSRLPELLDYLYFTVYTITTTGYGDIQPQDGFAKFVTSLANLYELFYIVILFNIVISVSQRSSSL